MSSERKRALSEWIWGLLAALATALLGVAAFPHPGTAEAAYVFAVPMILWVATRPRWRIFLPLAVMSGWLLWGTGLFWLRHVTWAGMFGLSFAVGLFLVLWLVVVRAWLPGVTERPAWARVLILFALAAAWVVLEWVRSWLFTGFPWMPLAATQWQRPAVLQSAAWAGMWSVSFILIVFNLGLAAYILQLARVFRRVEEERDRPRTRWWQRLCPEFYAALLVLVGAVLLFTLNLPRRDDQQLLFKAGFVQPWVGPEQKWTQARESWEALQFQTLAVSLDSPDLILWPEAATPWWVLNNKGTNARTTIEREAAKYNTPILMGNLAELPDGTSYNGIFFVDPEKGLFETFYAKTHLVPFGEYVPLRGVVPFLEDIGPLAHMGDFNKGTEPIVLPAEIAGQTLHVGPMVCFEDIFPAIARKLARDGVDFFYVATNNAWHGQEGAAYQHAAHSALRAVETRRPVLRCGNHGWSGWFDEYGGTRFFLTGTDGSIYARVSGAAPIYRDRTWAGRESFYVRHGDWFVVVCTLLVASVALARKKLVGKTTFKRKGAKEWDDSPTG